MDTHGHVWASFLWGHCSFLLGPGAHKVLFVPFKSLFPQSCVSSGGSMVGLMLTSSKRVYDIPRSAIPTAPAAGHWRSMSPQETILAQILWVGHAFCMPISEQLRQPGAWQAHCPRWAMHLNHLPHPDRSVFRVHHESTVSDVPCLHWIAYLQLQPSWQKMTSLGLRL